jgi:hypothetical protein
MYIDDGIICYDSETQAYNNVITVRHDLKQSGFVVNEAETHLIPNK